MFSMARNALVLFFSGRLFADQRKAVALIAVGVFLTALICIMLVKAGGVSLVAAAGVGRLYRRWAATACAEEDQVPLERRPMKRTRSFGEAARRQKNRHLE